MPDEASWLQSLLETRRPDPGPVVGRWALGIGDMVGRSSADARQTALAGPQEPLRRGGDQRGGVEFDGDDVNWSDVTEIHTRSLIEYLFTGGVDTQIDKLLLPWFPFRRKVIEAILRVAVRHCFEATAQAHGVDAISVRIRTLSDG